MRQQTYFYETEKDVLLPGTITLKATASTRATKTEWEYNGCGMNLKMGCRYDIVNNKAQNFRDVIVVPTFLGNLTNTHFEFWSSSLYGVDSGKGMQIRAQGKYYQDDGTIMHNHLNEINGLWVVAWFAKNYT